MSRSFTASWRALVSICAFVAVGAARAEVEVEGFKFADTAVVQGQVLQLNGAAVSSVLSAKSTAVAFYLPKKQTTMEGAVAEKGVKRIHFFMMRDVSARDLSNALLDRIRAFIAEDVFPAESEISDPHDVLKSWHVVERLREVLAALRALPQRDCQRFRQRHAVARNAVSAIGTPRVSSPAVSSVALR